MRLGTSPLCLSSSPELAFLPEVIWEALGRDVDDDDDRGARFSIGHSFIVAAFRLI